MVEILPHAHLEQAWWTCRHLQKQRSKVFWDKYYLKKLLEPSGGEKTHYKAAELRTGALCRLFCAFVGVRHCESTSDLCSASGDFTLFYPSKQAKTSAKLPSSKNAKKPYYIAHDDWAQIQSCQSGMRVFHMGTTQFRLLQVQVVLILRWFGTYTTPKHWQCSQ